MLASNSLHSGSESSEIHRDQNRSIPLSFANSASHLSRLAPESTRRPSVTSYGTFDLSYKDPSPYKLYSLEESSININKPATKKETDSVQIMHEQMMKKSQSYASMINFTNHQAHEDGLPPLRRVVSINEFEIQNARYHPLENTIRLRKGLKMANAFTAVVFETTNAATRRVKAGIRKLAENGLINRRTFAYMMEAVEYEGVKIANKIMSESLSPEKNKLLNKYYQGFHGKRKWESFNGYMLTQQSSHMKNYLIQYNKLGYHKAYKARYNGYDNKLKNNAVDNDEVLRFQQIAKATLQRAITSTKTQFEDFLRI